LIGLRQSVAINAKLEGAAKDQTVTVPITPAVTADDIVPAMTIPEGTAQTIGTVDMTLDKAKSVKIPWEGEEQKAYISNGTMIDTLTDQFIQAFRTISNLVEVDIASLYSQASKAYGIGGTAPFGSSVEDAAQMRKILNKNGAPVGNRSLIINSDASVKLGSLVNLTNVDNAGTDETLRNGVVTRLSGFGVRESEGIQTHIKGTGAGYLIDLGAGYPVGTTAIHIDTGSGTVLAGDVITIGTDPDKYVVVSGFAGDGDGDIVIAEPGLMVAATDGDAVAIEASYTANLAFSRNAIQLATRPPAIPVDMNGRPMDAAMDRILFVDTHSGIGFSIASYQGYHKMMIDIGLVWGTQMIKPEHAAILLG